MSWPVSALPPVCNWTIDDERDWDKWFKCSDIDPTTLSSAAVNQVRMRGYAWLFAHRLFLRPIRTYKLLRTFSRYMKKSDILKLLYSPFRRRSLSRKPDLPARMIELALKEPRLGTADTP
jgi:anaerobic magnesium-protoporphyrin IX monomethyl ester cyclase